jgi:hypothetical protein
MTARKSESYTIGDQSVSASPTPRKRTSSKATLVMTDKGTTLVPAAPRKSAADKQAAAFPNLQTMKSVRNENTAAKRAATRAAKSTSKAAQALVNGETTVAKVTASQKRAAKQATESKDVMSTLRGIEDESTIKQVQKLAAQLERLELQLETENVSGRKMPAADDSTKAHKDRDETVRQLRALGAGYDFIARIRRQPSSSNRGQVRLMCGLSRWDRVGADTAELTAAQRKSYAAAKEQGVSHSDALKRAAAAPKPKHVVDALRAEVRAVNAADKRAAKRA